MGLLGRFLSKIPPIRQCDSETKSKISSFFERITVYINLMRRQRQGGWGSAGGTMDGSALPQIFSVELARLLLIPLGFRLVWLGLLEHCVQLGQQLLTAPAVGCLDYVTPETKRLPEQLG